MQTDSSPSQNNRNTSTHEPAATQQNGLINQFVTDTSSTLHQNGSTYHTTTTTPPAFQQNDPARQAAAGTELAFQQNDPARQVVAGTESAFQQNVSTTPQLATGSGTNLVSYDTSDSHTTYINRGSCLSSKKRMSSLQKAAAVTDDFPLHPSDAMDFLFEEEIDDVPTDAADDSSASFISNIMTTGEKFFQSVMPSTEVAKVTEHTIAPDITEAIMKDEGAHLKRSSSDLLTTGLTVNLRSRKPRASTKKKKGNRVAFVEESEDSFIGQKNK